MKKAVISIICVIVAAALIVGGIFGVKYIKEKKSNTDDVQEVEIIDDTMSVFEKNKYYALFSVSTIDELNQTAEELGVEVKDGNSEIFHGYVIEAVEVEGITLDFEYEINEENELININAKYTPFEEAYLDNSLPAPHTGAEVKEKFDLLLKAVSSLIGTEVTEEDYYIIEQSDILEHNDDAFSKLYAMTAVLDCIIKDENSRYLFISNARNSDGVVYFKINVNLQEEYYDDELVAYVDLSQYYDASNQTMSEEEMSELAEQGDGAFEVFD